MFGTNSHTGQSPPSKVCLTCVSGSIDRVFTRTDPVGGSDYQADNRTDPVKGSICTSNGVSDKISVVGLDLPAGFVHPVPGGQWRQR
jgi:hypothetical protein